MGEVVTRSVFYADNGSVLKIFDSYLFEEVDEMNIIKVTEIPEFIAWLQAEYEKQKAGD